MDDRTGPIDSDEYYRLNRFGPPAPAPRPVSTSYWEVYPYRLGWAVRLRNPDFYNPDVYEVASPLYTFDGPLAMRNWFKNPPIQCRRIKVEPCTDLDAKIANDALLGLGYSVELINPLPF